MALQISEGISKCTPVHLVEKKITKVKHFTAFTYTETDSDTYPEMVSCPENGYRGHLATPFVCSVNEYSFIVQLSAIHDPE